LRTSASHGGGLPRPHEHEAEPHISQVTTDELLALLDSSVVIGALNRDDALHEAASQAVRAERDRHALAISALTYAEIFVGPLRVGARAVEVVARFAAQARIVELSADIARLAAELRSGRGLKLPTR
jgi:predicted nucleic acid-binding protein